MADIIQVKRGLAADATFINPILADGEIGLETDTRKIKLGDGVTAWNSLSYYSTSSLTTDQQDAINSANAPDAGNPFATIADIPTSLPVAWGGITGVLSAQADLNTAFGLKAPIASPTFTGTVSGITKSMVGLGNADNTTDANKPVSTAQQTALNLKADLASPTFSGIVGGITKNMVGLGNVINLDTTTTANITDSINKRFVTDALLTVLGNTSGSNTGDQTITLTGDVTGSGMGTFATAIGAGKVTNTMLAGSIAYSKLVLTGAILNADLAGSIAYSKLSLTGAILNADLAGSIVASKLVGTDIVIVGIIAAGTWQGTSIADAYIASASTWNAKQAAITTGAAAQYFRGDLSLATFPTTTASFTSSTDKNFVTDAQLVIIGNTSGTNTGDQNLAPYLLSATAASTYVPLTRTINSVPLSSNIVLTTADVGDSSNKRYVTDAQLTIIGNTSGTNTGDQNLSGLQPLDSDLTAIAALSPSNDDIIQRKSGAWTNRTAAQFKTDLILVKGDVGLGSVDNTSDVNKPVSTATQIALNLKYDASNPSNYISAGGAPVQSVFGRTGAVVAASGDYSAFYDPLSVQISGTALLSFPVANIQEDAYALTTVANALIVSANLKSIAFIPIVSTDHESLDDFQWDGITFNIENIIDNTSFDIRATAVSSSWGGYNISYKIILAS